MQMSTFIDQVFSFLLQNTSSRCVGRYQQRIRTRTFLEFKAFFIHYKTLHMKLT